MECIYICLLSTHIVLALVDETNSSFFQAMQSRPSDLTPLAIVLPHPSLPYRRSSRLSINSANSPHTPRSCPSPCLPIYYPANRKSTDSWNSSNGPDDMDFDWKPDQVLLLSRVSPLYSFFTVLVSSFFHEYIDFGCTSCPPCHSFPRSHTPF